MLHKTLLCSMQRSGRVICQEHTLGAAVVAPGPEAALSRLLDACEVLTSGMTLVLLHKSQQVDH